MKKSIMLLCIITLIIVVYSCKKNPGNSVTTGTTTVMPNLPPTAYQYFPTSGNDSLNRVATLGRVLFYEPQLSVNNSISCGSCHKQAYGFADNATFSTGYQGNFTARNAPGLTSLTENMPLFWDGRENNLQNLILRPITNHVEMGIEDADVLPAKLAALPYYKTLFGKAYGDTVVTLTRLSAAVSLFLQAIGPRSNMSRFDEFEAGNQSALTAQEINGMHLFDETYNCKSCHGGNSGGYGGVQSFKDIGLDANYTDLGRGGITGMAVDNGTFKVPNLRNVALTAPYMHDGRFATLGDVVDHYSTNILHSPNLDPALRNNDGTPKVFNITATDKAAIVAFLNTLTDYTTTTDPKFSNPFKIN